MTKNKNKIKFIISLLLTIAVMVTIFIMSAQTKDESASTSGFFTKFLVKIIYGDQTVTDEMFRGVSLLVRKTAHMTIFAVLFICAYNTVRSYIKTFKEEKIHKIFLAFPIAYIFAVFYACTDEFHQSFAGRGALFTDVITDSIGALIGAALVYFIMMNNKMCELYREKRFVRSILILLGILAIYTSVFVFLY